MILAYLKKALTLRHRAGRVKQIFSRQNTSVSMVLARPKGVVKSVMTRMPLAQLLRTSGCAFDTARAVFSGHGTDNRWTKAVYLVFTPLALRLNSDDSINAAGPVTEQEIALITPLIHRNRRANSCGIRL